MDWEVMKILSDNQHEVYVGSRTDDKLGGIPGVHHLALDVKAESLIWKACPKPYKDSYTARARSCLNHFSALPSMILKRILKLIFWERSK